jgi:hypothetical protein
LDFWPRLRVASSNAVVVISMHSPSRFIACDPCAFRSEWSIACLYRSPADTSFNGNMFINDVLSINLTGRDRSPTPNWARPKGTS